MTEHPAETHIEILNRIQSLEISIGKLAEAIEKVDNSTSELVMIFNGSKSFVTGIGHFAVWVTKIGSTLIIIAGLIYAIKNHGHLPSGLSVNESP